MKTGDLLELVREPQNGHDSCAIALNFNNKKIGYIPAEQNEVLSRLMDASVIELMAEITYLEPDAAAWENVHIAVYVLKEDASPAKESAYLTALETPHYYTLKHKNNTLTRLATKGNPIMNGEDFYKALVEHSKTDEVYDLIHNDIGSPQAMEDIVNDSLLVVNRKKLPADLQADGLVKAVEEGMIELDSAFDKKGYVVAQINRVAELSARIEQFVPVRDKQGDVFWEVVFKE